MKKIFYFLSLFFILLSSKSIAQSYKFYGERTFGGDFSELYVKILKNNNKLFLAGISSTTYVSSDKSDPNCNNVSSGNPDVWIVVIDPEFNIIWDKTYGGERGEVHAGNIIQSTQNELLFSIRSNSDSSCEKTQNNWSYPQFQNDYWICKIDSSGNKIWDKTIGSMSTDERPYIIKLTSGDYLVVGNSANSVSGDKTDPGYGLMDLWAVKLDSAGNKIWDKSYGGAGVESWYSVGAHPVSTEGIGAVPTDNGSFVIGGTTNSQMSGMVSGLGFGGRDIWLVKADSVGNFMWDARFGGSTNHDYFGSFIQTQDKGFIIVGTTGSPQGGSITDPQIGGWDVWVIKTDSLGNKEWDRRYGGTAEDFGISIAEAPGGGYWVSADTESPQGFDVSEPPYGTRDYWIFKIDSVGNKIWDRRFGGPGNNNVSNFVIMPDTSIFLAGTADTGITAVKEDFGKGLSDYWVVHFEYSDNIPTTGIEEINSIKNLTLYPNPTYSELNIHFTLNNAAKTEIKLFNSLGQVVKTIKEEKLNAGENKINLSTEELPAGVYYLKFAAGDKIVNKKVIKM